jgi:hypothetical protein
MSGVEDDLVTVASREKHTVDARQAWMLNLELAALKILLHDQPALGEISKQDLIATVVYAVCHVLLASSSKTQTLATAKEIENAAANRVGTPRCLLDHVGE